MSAIRRKRSFGAEFGPGGGNVRFHLGGDLSQGQNRAFLRSQTATSGRSLKLRNTLHTQTLNISWNYPVSVCPTWQHLANILTYFRFNQEI